MTNNVATESEEYQRLSKLWKLPRTLMGGTKAMREAATLYLPQEQNESPDAYKSRLLRTTLFNAFKKTVKDMTGKVFRREIVLGDDVPQKLRDQMENADLAGRHLNVFARDVFFDGMQTGINFIMVEMPPALTAGTGRNGEVTQADESKAGRRPYFCHLKAEDVIGWIAENVNGVMTLVQMRIRECVTVKVDEWTTAAIPQIRVLYPGRWETWRQAEKDGPDGIKKGDWYKFEEGVTTVKKITVAPVYINRTGFMTGEPPLEDLADLNVAHWQSQSDQRNILHVARVPILFGKGFDSESKISIGANSMVRTTDKDADLKWVEHTGAAIEAGDKDLQNIEQQMQTQGLQLLVRKPGTTATGEIHDDSKENSPLAMMAHALGDAIEQALGFAAEYEGLGEDGGSVTVNTDFGISVQGTTDLPTLLQVRTAGEISRETFLNEMKRRDGLSEDVDVDDEISRIQNEPPPLDSANPMNLDA